jgi:hypothetical protein
MMKKELHISMSLVAVLLLYVTTGNYQKAIQTKYLIESICTKVKRTLNFVFIVLKTKSSQSDHFGTELNEQCGIYKNQQKLLHIHTETVKWQAL